MIYFKINDIDYNFNITTSSSISLKIEDKKYYRNILLDLAKMDTERFELNENFEKNLNISKNILFIDNIIDLSIDSKMMTNYYSIFQEKFYSEEKRDIVNEIESLFSKLFILTQEDSPLELDYEDNITYKTLLSMIKLKASMENQNYLEKFLYYVKYYIEVNNCKLIIVPFIEEILSENEIKMLIHEIELLNSSILFISSSSIIKDANERIIIDEDMCII